MPQCGIIFSNFKCPRLANAYTFLCTGAWSAGRHRALGRQRRRRPLPRYVHTQFSRALHCRFACGHAAHLFMVRSVTSAPAYVTIEVIHGYWR